MRAPILTFKRARRLRRDMSLPEVLLWRQLRGQRLAGLRFRRQHPIGPYVIDFYCPTAKLAVEVDGAYHDYHEQIRRDARRDAWLAEKGIAMMRVAAIDILKDEHFEGVLIMIAEAAGRAAFSEEPPPPSCAWSPSPVNGGGSRASSSPAKRKRGTAEDGGGDEEQRSGSGSPNDAA